MPAVRPVRRVRNCDDSLPCLLLVNGCRRMRDGPLGCGQSASSRSEACLRIHWRSNSSATYLTKSINNGDVVIGGIGLRHQRWLHCSSMGVCYWISRRCPLLDGSVLPRCGNPEASLVDWARKCDFVFSFSRSLIICCLLSNCVHVVNLRGVRDVK